MQHKDGPPTRHLTVHTGGEPPYDPDYDRPTDTRRPPQDLDAERALLAVLIQNPDLGDQLRTEVEPGDFYRPTHEKIWATWHHLHQADGVPPDVVTLNSALIRDRETEAVRELADLATTAASPLHATQYAAIVRDHARLRVVDHVATSLRDVVTRGTVENVAKYLEEAVERIDDAYGRFGARTGHVTPTTWTPVDLTAVLAGEMLDPPPTMLQRTDGVSLFYDGAVHTVAGESESGKTWFCLLAALQLLQAGDDITFLDFEDRADRVIGRLLALGATPTQIQQHFAYVRPDRPLDDDGRAQLAPAITGRRLVIVDGVTEAMTMHGFDLNSNADSALFQGLIPRWIADHGPAVVMIDHVVKDKEKQDRFALGAQHKLAGIDGVAYIVKMLQPFARGHRGVARVEVAKDRPGHVREHARGRTIAEFTLDASVSDLILTADLVPPGHETGRGDDQAWEPTVIMERISRAVQLTPGLSKKALEDITQGKAATKRLALELLVTRGYVLAKQGARGAITHFHVKPFYADGDPTEQTPDDTPASTSEQTPEGGAA